MFCSKAGARGHAREALAHHLHAWRDENNVPLKALATELGVSISTVSAWEHGKRFPSGDHLDRLSEFTEMPVCALLYHGTEGCPHGGVPVEALP